MGFIFGAGSVVLINQQMNDSKQKNRTSEVSLLVAPLPNAASKRSQEKNMSILDNAKDIVDLAKKYSDQDLYERIVSLRDEIFELKDENRKLKKRVSPRIQELTALKGASP